MHFLAQYLHKFCTAVVKVMHFCCAIGEIFALKLMLIYNKKLQQDQWTLDRTNNYKGHNNENTVISCLQCNIQRRRTNDKKFLFSKQLIIHKLDK